MFRKFLKRSCKLTAFALAAALSLAAPMDTAFATEPAQSSGQSADAYLKKFSVTPGTVSPSFSSSTTNYTIDIPLESESVSVTCSVANPDSKVIAASGFKNLQPGNNSAYIEVQDANGGTCKYTFTIVRGGSTGDAAATDAQQTETAAPAETEPAQPEETETAPEETQESAADEETAGGSQYDIVRVKEKVNVRSGESTDTDKLGQVEGGQELTRYEELESGWSKIDYNGQEGYIKTEFLELVSAATAAAEPSPDAAAPVAVGADAYSEDMKVNDGSVFNEYYVLPTFDDSILPQGFTAQDYTYRGKTVKSAYFAPGNVRMLYLSLPNNDNIDFRLYYEETDEFMDFWPMYGKDGKFIFPVKYEAQIKTPDNYTNTTLPSDVKVVPAFIYTELTGNKLTVQEGMESKDTLQPGESAADESVDITSLDEEPEFYLMYCVNQDGQENFYLYDWKEDTYQRYVERDTSSELDKSYLKYKTVANRRFAIIAVLIVLLVVAVFIILNLYLKQRGSDEGEEEEEEDFYERRAKREAAAKERAEAKAEERERAKREAAQKRRAERAEKEALKREEEEVSEDDFEEEPEAEEPVRKAVTRETAQRESTRPTGRTAPVRTASARQAADQISRAPRVGFNRPDTSSSRVTEEEEESKPVRSTARPMPTAAKPEVRTTAPSASGITMTSMPHKSTESRSKGDIEAEAVAKKLRDTLDIPVVTDSTMKSARATKTVKPKRPAGGKDDFKMINLSRSSESSGLDDDFEFEFIKLDDNE